MRTAVISYLKRQKKVDQIKIFKYFDGDPNVAKVLKDLEEEELITLRKTGKGVIIIFKG